MKTYTIFVSSPGDVRAERQIAARVIERVNAWFGERVELSPYFWEHEPMLATRGDFQGQIPDTGTFDLVICILWSRLGSPLHPINHRRKDGSPYVSGTEYEFEKAIEAFQAKGKPELLVYRREELPHLPIESEVEENRVRAQWKTLQSFWDKWFKEDGLFKTAYSSYRDSGDFERIFEDHLKKLVIQMLKKSGEAPATGSRPRRWWKGSPYRGLEAFDMEHEKIFFGRTRATDEVLSALRFRASDEKCPFVMIYGASGSGKSSLMRSGVLPWLTKPGVIDGVEVWRHALLRPADRSGDLVTILAATLATALPELLTAGTEEKIADVLRTSPQALVGMIIWALGQVSLAKQKEQNLPLAPTSRVALGMDQLEEVFTLQDRFTLEDRRQLFRAIAALVRSGYVWVIATLRSDFFNRCEDVPELIELTRGRGQYRLLPPNEIELSQMIRFPAEAAGVIFEEDPKEGKLEEVIAREAQNQPGALPLLEYALEMLYEKGNETGVLTHAQYNEIGRVTGAVAKKAEQTFAGLPDLAQESLDSVLRQLVLLSEGGGEELPSRRVAVGEEMPRDGASLVEAFTEARLFISDKDSAGRATVTVAHEALLRQWPRAVEWIEENRSYLRQRGRLDSHLKLWLTHEKHPDYLLAKGLPLTEAEGLIIEFAGALTPDEMAYIATSRDKARKTERTQATIWSGVAIGASLLAVVALVASLIAFQTREAQIEGTARLLMDLETDTQDFTLNKVDPLIDSEVEERRDLGKLIQASGISVPKGPNDTFHPEAVPFFAAQEVFKQISAKYPGCHYRPAALNPTNPDDQATPADAGVIQNFIDHPGLVETSYKTYTPEGQQVFCVARPIVVSSLSCLQCHGDPATAPEGMTDHYGKNNGFGWTQGQTVGAQIVEVPTSSTTSLGAVDIYILLLMAAGIFGALVAGFKLFWKRLKQR